MTTACSYQNQTYASRTPYLTSTEYINSPTSMDTSNLVPGGNPAAQLTALVETINRACSWIDQYCCGGAGTLCSTAEYENARTWGSYRGTLTVHPRYWPITEVRSFSYSNLPAGLIQTKGASNAASVDPSTSIVIYPQEFEVVQAGVVNLGLTANAGIEMRTEYTCQFQYVCGWANTLLSASVAAGASSVTPVNVTGIYPGMAMTLYDLPNDEYVTVSSDYATGGSVVPLTASLAYDHSTSATLTSLPPAIKQAAILATTAFIKERGSGALIVQDIGELTKKQTGFAQDSAGDWAQAMQLLNPYRTIYVGY